MYRLYCEGGVIRAWWVVSLSQWVLSMPWGFTPRHAPVSRDPVFLLQNMALLSSGRIVPRVTIAEGSSIYPT